MVEGGAQRRLHIVQDYQIIVSGIVKGKYVRTLIYPAVPPSGCAYVEIDIIGPPIASVDSKT